MRRALTPGLLMYVVVVRVLAQQVDAARFDVVSIKPNPTTTSEVSSRMQPPRYNGVGVTGMRLVTMGFLDVTDRIEGGPDWLQTERYDVQAIWSGPTEDSRLRAMMRNLVIDGFKLRSHIESRDVPAYALMRARSDRQFGPKLALAAVQNCVGQAPTTAGAG